MTKERRVKLTEVAIRFIINKRSDPHTNYTFEEIADLLKTEFDIEISFQAVAKSYHKNKNDKYFQTKSTVINDKSSKASSEVKLNNTNVKLDNSSKTIKSVEAKEKDSVKPVFEPIEVKTNSGKDFDEDAGRKYNPADFLK
ncbi:MAG: hypothetical protein ACTJGV_01985 [Proteus vulgaris]